ncbi:MAG: hypothetical protein E6G08_01565 [Actinobacteria bacterium]|nr:MAG: hypothetical protein E6G08_01565 [Actinomycetota bacterium]
MLGEISRALELRDRMRGHGDRVTALAEAIALRLGWDADRLVTFRYAAPLHDIGQGCGVTGDPREAGAPHA